MPGNQIKRWDVYEAVRREHPGMSKSSSARIANSAPRKVKRFAQGGTILAGAASYDPQLAALAEQMDLLGPYVQSTAPASRPTNLQPARQSMPVGPNGRTFDEITGKDYLSPEERAWYLSQASQRNRDQGNKAEQYRLGNMATDVRQGQNPLTLGGAAEQMDLLGPLYDEARRNRPLTPFEQAVSMDPGAVETYQTEARNRQRQFYENYRQTAEDLWAAGLWTQPTEPTFGELYSSMTGEQPTIGGRVYGQPAPREISPLANMPISQAAGRFPDKGVGRLLKPLITPIKPLVKVQDLAGDIVSTAAPTIMRALPGPLGTIGNIAANTEPGRAAARTVGRVAGESLIPTTPIELGLELVPGIGSAPDLFRLGRTAGRRILREAALPAAEAAMRRAPQVGGVVGDVLADIGRMVSPQAGIETGGTDLSRLVRRERWRSQREEDAARGLISNHDRGLGPSRGRVGAKPMRIGEVPPADLARLDEELPFMLDGMIYKPEALGIPENVDELLVTARENASQLAGKKGSVAAQQEVGRLEAQADARQILTGESLPRVTREDANQLARTSAEALIDLTGEGRAALQGSNRIRSYRAEVDRIAKMLTDNPLGNDLVRSLSQSDLDKIAPIVPGAATQGRPLNFGGTTLPPRPVAPPPAATSPAAADDLSAQLEATLQGQRPQAAPPKSLAQAQRELGIPDINPRTGKKYTQGELRKAIESARAKAPPELPGAGVTNPETENLLAEMGHGKVTHPSGKKVPATPENVDAAVKRALSDKPGSLGPNDVGPEQLATTRDPKPGLTSGEVGVEVKEAIIDTLREMRTPNGELLLDGLTDDEIEAAVDRLLPDMEVIAGRGGADGTTPVMRTRMREPGTLSIGGEDAYAGIELPSDLRRAKPTYNYGKKHFNLVFTNDVDRAAYITAQASKSKRDADFVAFVQEATGYTEAEVRQMGRSIKARIKTMARDATPGDLSVPSQGVYDPNAPARGLSGPRAEPPVNEYGMAQGLPAGPQPEVIDPAVAARREALRVEREAGAQTWAAEQEELRRILAGEQSAPIEVPPNATREELTAALRESPSPAAGGGAGEPPRPPSDGGPGLPSGRQPGGPGGREPPKPGLLRRARREWDRRFKMGDRPEEFSVWEEVKGILGIPQTSLTILDLSGAARQGAVLGWANPEQWKAAIKSGFRAISEENALKIDRALREHYWYDIPDGPLAGMGAKDRVHFYEWGPNVAGGERVPGFTGLSKSHVSRLQQALPGVGTSERTFATILNTQGMEVYAKYARAMSDAGMLADPAEAKRLLDALADVINHARGYGDFDVGRILPGFNAFFSGRNLVSRFQVILDPILQPGALNPIRVATGALTPREVATRNLAAFIGANMTMLGFLGVTGSMAGGLWSVDFDPRAGDWGKVRIGNSTIDPWAGFGPIVRGIVRSATGEGVSQAGDVYDTNWKREWLQFFRNKQAPVPSLVTEYLTGEDYIGRPSRFQGGLSPNELLSIGRDTFVPFIAQDTVEAYMVNEGGLRLPAAIAVGAGSLVGAGAASYPPSLEQQLSEALVGQVPASERLDSSGNVIDRWNQLTGPQQLAIKRKYGGAFNELTAPEADKQITPVEQITIDIANGRGEAWSEFQSAGDGKSYRAAMSDLSAEARARYDQEIGDQGDRKERSPDRQLIADFFAELDKAGNDFDERDRLETRFRAELTDAQNKVLDDVLASSSDPNYEKLKAARTYIDQNYWSVRDETYAKIAARAQPGSLASKFPTYDSLVEAANDKSADLTSREQARALLSHVQGILSQVSETQRAQDPKLDALLYVYGYTETVLTLEARQAVEAWAKANGVTLGTALGRKP